MAPEFSRIGRTDCDEADENSPLLSGPRALGEHEKASGCFRRTPGGNSQRVSPLVRHCQVVGCPFLAAALGVRAPRRSPGRTLMRLARVSLGLGTRMCSTPSCANASILSASTWPGRVIERRKAPCRCSDRCTCSAPSVAFGDVGGGSPGRGAGRPVALLPRPPVAAAAEPQHLVLGRTQVIEQLPAHHGCHVVLPCSCAKPAGWRPRKNTARMNTIYFRATMFTVR
jgi:hypothetical protein